MKKILTILLLVSATAFGAESVQYLPNGITVTSGADGTYTITVPSNQDITLTTSGTGRIRAGTGVAFTGTATTYTDNAVMRADGTTGQVQQSSATISDAGALAVGSVSSIFSASGNASAATPAFMRGNSGFFFAGVNGNIQISIGGTEKAGINTTGFYIGTNASPMNLTASGTGAITFAGTGTAYLITGTTAAPSNTVTPVGYTDMVISGTTFKIPLYQ